MKRFVNDPVGLAAYLDALSNAKFRQAGKELSDSYLPSLTDEQFMEHFRVLFKTSPKAYLGTLLKAFVRKYAGSPAGCLQALLAPASVILSLVPAMSDLDRQKIVRALMPRMKSPDEVELLLGSLECMELKIALPMLIDEGTLPSSFVLMKLMRYHEEEKRLLTKTAAYLMNKGDKLSFNMASLMKTAFSLDDLRGVFSLTLAPWELSKIETDYTFFCQKMSF